ncbi:pectin lyase fold/virulence factor [Aspergillus karnatakaensis]|uniref:putative pectin methylesterase n=1 Tax=Aspergillus karnatakaensis TaxID=1810916 RepID=UPI003CCCF7C7
MAFFVRTLLAGLCFGSAVLEECQASTPRNPLKGCPKNTILVSATHKRAPFAKIQDAIDSLPHDNSPHTILILSGDYTEQLNITRPGPLTLLGETNNPHDASKNTVNVLWAAATEQGIYTDNVYTSVLIVAPTLNASLTGYGPSGLPVPEGTPFGNTDFRTYNIDFRNNYAEQSAGPAHSLSLSRANGGFYFSGFYSFQDTVYVGKLGNAYFHSSIIAGQTDFLYGFGTAWVEDSEVVLRSCGGGITAWKGTNTTYENKFGVYIHNSRVQAANATVAEDKKGKCALGRPWNSGHRSIFAKTYLDETITDSGYILWQAPITYQTLMAEFETWGPGFDVQARRGFNYSVLLDEEGWDRYSTPKKVFLTEDGGKGNDGWVDGRFKWW